jgi:3-hydroxyisobutyrate dehydrogenase-like beta-hydroxyacid dehydrogenase
MAGETVGLVGVGLVGTALAGRFAAAGFAVVGWDRDPARRAALAALGCRPADRPADVFAAPRVAFSLPDLSVSAAVVRDHLADLRPGLLILDTTTGAPDQAERLGADLAAAGVTYLDATISGSSDQVRRGEVTVTAGGPAEGFETCGDLFACFAKSARHVGPVGGGSRMKLVSNLVLGLNRAALAEGLALADAFGLDPAAALAALRDGMAYSRIMDTKGPKMVAGDYAPEARLSQHLKDVRLMLAAAGNLALPLSEAHRRLLEAAEAAGHGGSDNSAVRLAYGGADGR